MCSSRLFLWASWEKNFKSERELVRDKGQRISAGRVRAEDTGLALQVRVRVWRVHFLELSPEP
jgi:hypothetical protein